MFACITCIAIVIDVNVDMFSMRKCKLHKSRSTTVRNRRVMDLVSYITNALHKDDIIAGYSTLQLKCGKDIIPIGHDSKCVSHLLQVIVSHLLRKALDKLDDCTFVENTVQNSYPDYVIAVRGLHYAIDMKSCYRKNANQISGFTLGTYRGYFKDRTTKRCIYMPYENFDKHVCICVVYSRLENTIRVADLFVREKWQIASKHPGSGNTKNIGSIKNLKDISSGKTCFKNERDFDKYWMHYGDKPERNEGCVHRI